MVFTDGSPRGIFCPITPLLSHSSGILILVCAILSITLSPIHLRTTNTTGCNVESSLRCFSYVFLLYIIICDKKKKKTELHESK